jgi:hypothetical protein
MTKLEGDPNVHYIVLKAERSVSNLITIQQSRKDHHRKLGPNLGQTSINYDFRNFAKFYFQNFRTLHPTRHSRWGAI